MSKNKFKNNCSVLMVRRSQFNQEFKYKKEYKL